MAGFVYEKNLPHQTRAVEGIMSALEGVSYRKGEDGIQNPVLTMSDDIIRANLEVLRDERGFQQAYDINSSLHIFDISMETGTGKTYAYTKTMMELNASVGLAKFIVAVPRVAIKAGTVNFLKSDAARAHFRDEYGRDIKVYEVTSQKGRKQKKDFFPQAISDFIRADIAMNKNTIHVLVINAGMITAKKKLNTEAGDKKVRTLDWKHDVSLLDRFNTPNEAIVHTRPVLIVDEPHMFKRGNAAFRDMMKFKPQFVLRYGATFDGDLVNMVNELTAVDAFNENLVKGINAYVNTFPDAKNATVTLTMLENGFATFTVNGETRNGTVRVGNGESLTSVHANFGNLSIAKISKSNIVLNDGTIWQKGETHNPYAFDESLQETMMKNAVRAHFETERELFLENPRIKPLALFFIDNIQSYRPENGMEGHLRSKFESILESHIKSLIKGESDSDYKAHLQTALKNISALHGGYFSKDNSDKDEAIEAETLEILHEKEKLLDLSNPRRFIFSKWTLREGWDNPNIFTICKLRSSGSETSKLQEVGRGLRLPVNEYGSRVKNKTYFLNYFVDFTERNFVDTLIGEINSKSAVQFDTVMLEDRLIERLLKAYQKFNKDKDTLLRSLDDDGIIKRDNSYKEGGFKRLKQTYPRAFGSTLNGNKIKKGDGPKRKATIRAGKYKELKDLWERLNRKVVLEYKFEKENELEELFVDFIREKISSFTETGMMTETYQIRGTGGGVTANISISETNINAIKMMSYQQFLKELAMATAMSITSLHNSFNTLKKENGLDIEPYLSPLTVRKIRTAFNDYLIQNVFCKFKIGYKEASNAVHPTKLTDPAGHPFKEIDSAAVGINLDTAEPPSSYLFNEIFYDGELEQQNIHSNIREVTVFAKIPKNSIRIPIVGGGSYSPDFAYLIRTDSGKETLSLVVETKGKDAINLGQLEKQKIKHAENFFNAGNSRSGVKVQFETQLNNTKLTDLIRNALSTVDA